MPVVKTKSSAGSLQVHYTISTPTASDSKTIDPRLPTLLFLHPVYMASDLWHMQFADRKLRQFNLVAVDLRAHGETGGECKKNYNQETSAEDIAKFIEAAKLPACHIVGLSMGTIIAIQLAISYPKLVASLFLVSPLGLAEPDEVTQGREEIGEYWVEGLRSKDESALTDAVHGALQLGFNNVQTNMVSALTARSVPLAAKNWTAKTIDSYMISTVKFFTERKEHPPDKLRQITCPVKLVHCLGDIAYPLEYSKEFLGRLKDVGIDASLDTIADAPHFGPVTHPHRVNPILRDFVTKHTAGVIPPPPASAVSPFEKHLVKCGLKSADSEEDD
ncbi:alpha/beta-hydrolase [Cylindrobasidium torrendii FP15055 ss-10]|uniref:Alpha/beta-hydrolase n=1 Tax=Cylindrobasidium torrendii FP15055 ss-10 TaxID=1314674 RepID=A0A0D7BEF1_9AGAR|nr:alpha/beta-hydrolase [Cylindrobasidium torrendii FP15055 ss-10]